MEEGIQYFNPLTCADPIGHNLRGRDDALTQRFLTVNVSDFTFSALVYVGMNPIGFNTAVNCITQRVVQLCLDEDNPTDVNYIKL